MYVCLECREIFAEPRGWIESHGEKWNGCPYCCGQYVDAKLCDVCGEYITGKRIEVFDERRQVICDECYVEYDLEEV